MELVSKYSVSLNSRRTLETIFSASFKMFGPKSQFQKIQPAANKSNQQLNASPSLSYDITIWYGTLNI